MTGPNQLWCMDFKGYFATGDGKRCDPFTITDAHSRYLIRCQIVSRIDLSQVRAICEAAMREYGVPARIRTDNGAPFAGTGLLGLSKLSLGWMKLGIVHERIQAGRTATKRPPRADASHAEGGPDEAACGIPSCTAESLRSFSLRVQQ